MNMGGDAIDAGGFNGACNGMVCGNGDFPFPGRGGGHRWGFFSVSVKVTLTSLANTGAANKVEATTVRKMGRNRVLFVWVVIGRFPCVWNILTRLFELVLES